MLWPRASDAKAAMVDSTTAVAISEQQYPRLSPTRKRFWLFLEWVGTKLFSTLPDTPTVNRWLAKLFYFFVNKRGLPNLKAPQYFNEKLINLKISEDGRTPLRARVTDKEFVKKYVAQKCGPDFVVPTIAVLRSTAELNRFYFPTPCVVKPTHSSQEVMFLKDAQPFANQKRQLRYWMSKSYFNAGREPNYRDLEKKLIVEPVIGGAFGHIDDVKVLCFHGRAKLIHIDQDRFHKPCRDFYDINGNHLPIEMRHPSASLPFPYHEQLSEIIRIVELLSADFRFIRVDLYITQNAVLVGELTSFPTNCVQPFRPLSADLIIARAFDDPAFEIAPSLFPKNTNDSADGARAVAA